ncbi:hypothetical protein [Halorussus sp. MSC15.2]|uniref:hypothetical protein n=1 Tax=Halorussus sp. MSC15.2 TaxID=2283638 RepID=UPI0013D1B0F6|nr:hypothetical protein [Halorussus sp. MSC15.2]NEU59116.1 hypothetical protein [Halorussus sp. MSC15.2]
MPEMNPATRRAVLKKSAATAGVLSGISVVGAPASAAYEHTLRVEADGGSGAFRTVIYASDYTTENWEGDDLDARAGGDSVRIESYVDSGAFSPGYDVVKYNGSPDSPDDFTINEYSDNVVATLDGEVIPDPT